MSQRKIYRNYLKKKFKTNKIAAAWKEFQQKRYGLRMHGVIVSQNKRSTFQKILSIFRRNLA